MFSLSNTDELVTRIVKIIVLKSHAKTPLLIKTVTGQEFIIKSNDSVI